MKFTVSVIEYFYRTAEKVYEHWFESGACFSVLGKKLCLIDIREGFQYKLQFNRTPVNLESRFTGVRKTQYIKKRGYPYKITPIALILSSQQTK